VASYSRDLNAVWKEMEKLFLRGDFRPEQESDVQAYLYHGLLSRLSKDGIRPVEIRTEETFKGVGRVDLNVNDRLFIEIKLLSRKRRYGTIAWKKKEKSLGHDARKLKGYLRTIRSDAPGVHLRQPVQALWNWKASPDGLDEDFRRRLEHFRERMRNQGIIVIYGPKGAK
jgi:hypothetical protein